MALAQDFLSDFQRFLLIRQGLVIIVQIFVAETDILED